MSRPCFVMLDGAPLPIPLPERNAAVVAMRLSVRRPRSDVATCRLGDARSLRRFEAGREVLP